MTKKVVLIAAGNDFAGNANVIRFTSLLAPPLGILALGSYLADRGVPVELIDSQMDFGFGLTEAAERAVARGVARYLQTQAEEVAWVGISQLSNAGSGAALAREIHAALPGVPIVMGGYFPSSAYPALLQQLPFVAAIVRGDGEAAALQITRCLEQERSFLCDTTPNLAWRDGDQIRTTPVRPMDVADLPILDFRLLRHRASYQIVDLMTSRGCPFRCSYCLEDSMRPYAAHAPGWVARQLRHLQQELPNRRVFIYDPVFGLGRERTLAICRVWAKHEFTYAIESRVDVLDPGLVPELHANGVETIFLGIESASPATLLRMNKVRSLARGQEYVRDARKVLHACLENNVTPVMGLMLSFPGDTRADYQATLDLVKEIGCLHDELAKRTGFRPGFVPFAFYTKIYDGTPLGNGVDAAYPKAALRREPFIGERTVLSPSPGVDLAVTQQYQAEIASHSGYTALARKRLRDYFSFSMEAFLQEHPGLTDPEGIVILGDDLARFPQEFEVASALMRFDKSKHMDQV
jgi:radical SAM superfamily enzyme YgiQ (UPF0313 family)